MIIWTISILEDNMTQQIILYPSYPPVIESFKVRYNNNILLYMKKRHLDFCYLCPRERRFSMSRFTRTKHNTNTLNALRYPWLTTTTTTTDVPSHVDPLPQTKMES